VIRWAQSKPEWALGFQDECWWSRVTDPAMHTWSEADQPLRLRQKENDLPPGGRKALACYGLWLPLGAGMLLRFAEGRPVSAVTEEYLEWVSGELTAAGKSALFLVWDNAPWHVSKQVREWLREHNRKVKRGEKHGVRFVVCPLPKKSPWLNPIEAKWIHGKRNIAQAGEVLDEIELMARAYEHFRCPASPMLSSAVS
jgi:DDE superfamily endonuclease